MAEKRCGSRRAQPRLVEALEDSVAMDLFSPIREDWIRGDYAYLR